MLSHLRSREYEMSRRSNTKKKFPNVDPTLIDKLFDHDPYRGAYGEWMVGRVDGGEHPDKVIGAVALWHECRNRLPKNQRDLYRYADTQALQNAVDALGGMSKRKQRHTKGGYTVLHEYPNITFYRVDSLAGMQVLGRDTKWCLSRREHFVRYAAQKILVAVSRVRPTRDPYSKFAIIVNRDTDPNQFIPWGRIKGNVRRGSGIEQNIWDALDRKGAHLQEILDMLAGHRGATNDAVLEALGGAAKAQMWGTVYEILESGRLSAVEALHVADLVATHGLFNPLSLLDHPDVRSIKTIHAIWHKSTKAHQDALSQEALKQLVTRPAVNIPELLELYWAKIHSGAWRPEAALMPLIGNKRMTAETKERVAKMFREDVLKLSS